MFPLAGSQFREKMDSYNKKVEMMFDTTDTFVISRGLLNESSRKECNEVCYEALEWLRAADSTDTGDDTCDTSDVSDLIAKIGYLKIANDLTSATVLKDNGNCKSTDFVCLPAKLVQKMANMLNTYAKPYTTTQHINTEWLKIYKDYHRAMFAGHEMDRIMEREYDDGLKQRLREAEIRIIGMEETIKEKARNTLNLVCDNLRLESEIEMHLKRIADLNEVVDNLIKDISLIRSNYSLERTIDETSLKYFDALVLHGGMYMTMRNLIQDFYDILDSADITESVEAKDGSHYECSDYAVRKDDMESIMDRAEHLVNDPCYKDNYRLVSMYENLRNTGTDNTDIHDCDATQQLIFKLSLRSNSVLSPIRPVVMNSEDSSQNSDADEDDKTESIDYDDDDDDDRGCELFYASDEY